MTPTARPARNGTAHPLPSTTPRAVSEALARLVSPHTGFDVPNGWHSDPSKWGGNGSHDVEVDVDCAIGARRIAAKLTLKQFAAGYELGQMWLDVEMWGAENANGGDVDRYTTTIELDHLALLTLAEAFRRIVPLAQAHGLIPETPE